MAKREKRLEKGIKSIEEQIKLHEKKREAARELGKEELVMYYDKEIKRFENEKLKKEDKLKK
jgi:hypothetical protein